MMIHEITPLASKNKDRKRLGRGPGSGTGKTAGRGFKGAGSRSGWSGSIRASREGGQTPFFKRFPKRGFTNAEFKVEYAVVNLHELEKAFDAGAEVTPEALIKIGLLADAKLPLKVLGQGQLKKSLKVSAHKFSKAAEAAITKVGGSATTL